MFTVADLSAQPGDKTPATCFAPMFNWLRRHPLLCILLAAFMLRAAAAAGVQWYLDRQPGRQFLIEGDARGYWELGRDIAAGREYAVYDPPRRILRMPGFPAVLALAGGNLILARLLLAGVGTGACWLVYRLGFELLDRRTGLLAAALAAVSPTFVGFSVLILSETLFAATLTASLILMVRTVSVVRCQLSVDSDSTAVSQNSRRHPLIPPRSPLLTNSLLGGLATAAACYVRPSWLLAGPLFAVLLPLLVRPRGRAILAGLLVLLGQAAALAPWVYRNWLVTDGRLVVTTLWVGPSLYDAFNPAATGESDMTFFDEDRLGERMSEYEVDRHYRRKAWQFVRENPDRAAEFAVFKLARFWSPWPNAEQFQHPLLVAAVCGFFLLIMPAAAWGWWKNRRRFAAWLPSVGPVLYFSAVHAVFVGSLRYRLPAEYPLLVLSAWGVLAWKDWITRSPSRPAPPAADTR